LGGGEEEGVAGGGLEGHGVPAGLHEARRGVGVGAEEEVADFVGDDEAEHVAIGEQGVFTVGGEIVVIDVGVGAGAGLVEEGLAENVRANGAAARKDADRELTRPGDGGAGRGALREVRGIGAAAVEPIELDAGLSEDCSGAGGGLGERIGGDASVVEDGKADVRGEGVRSAGGSKGGGRCRKRNRPNDENKRDASKQVHGEAPRKPPSFSSGFVSTRPEP